MPHSFLCKSSILSGSWKYSSIVLWVFCVIMYSKCLLSKVWLISFYISPFLQIFIEFFIPSILTSYYYPYHNQFPVQARLRIKHSETSEWNSPWNLFSRGVSQSKKYLFSSVFKTSLYFDSSSICYNIKLLMSSSLSKSAKYCSICALRIFLSCSLCPTHVLSVLI
jgi:hypothetical protein